MFSRRNLKWATVLVLVVIISSSVYALSAANTVPSSQAGEGSEVITGYTVNDVHYILNGSDSSLIDSVTFTLTPSPGAGSQIKIKLVTPSGSWYACSPGAIVTCNTTGATVSAANNLTVVATS